MQAFPFSNNGNPAAQAETQRSIITLQGVTKWYKTAAGDYPVLKGIDLELEAGEFVSIVGKSGSGKTTLLNMITGIDRPTAGEVWVNHTALHTLSEGQMAHWRGRNLGIVFQFFQLLPTLSVLENIMLPMDFCGKVPFRERKAACPVPARTGGTGGPGLQAAFGAFRRTAAARGHQPGPGQRPAGADRRRTDRQPGLENSRRWSSSCSTTWLRRVNRW